MKQLILAAVVLGVLPRAGATGTFPNREQSLPQLARASARVFVGTVRQLRYRPDPRSGLIHSDVRFGAVTVLKGRPSVEPGRAERVIRVAGGRDRDGTLVRVTGVPHFKVGERYLIFERGGARPFCSLAGWDQGCYHLVPRPVGGGWVVLDANDAPVLGIRDDMIQRLRPPASLERQSLFGAAVPRAIGSDPRVVAPLDPDPGFAPEGNGPVPHRPPGPVVLRLTGTGWWRTGTERPTPTQLDRAMPARAFLAEVRRAIAGEGMTR